MKKLGRPMLPALRIASSGGKRKQAGTILGHAEALLEADALFSGVLFDQRHGQRRTATGAETQTAHIGGFPIGRLSQHLVHGRHRGKDRHLLALDQLQHLGRVELPGQDSGIAEDNLRRDVGKQSARVKERKDAQVDVIVVADRG